MPILMVAQQQFNNLNFSDSDLSEDREPIDFTMSKFKSSTPVRHPLYHQFFGSHSDMTLVKEEPGRECREIIYNALSVIPTKRSARLRASLIVLFIHISLSVSCMVIESPPFASPLSSGRDEFLKLISLN